MNNWTRIELDEVCINITVGYVGTMADEYVDKGVLFLRSQNILPYRLNLESDQIKYISTDFNNKIRKSKLNSGDLAVVRTGYPGTACVIPEGFEEVNCADLVIVRPDKVKADSTFLCYYINSPVGKGAIFGSLVGVAQQHFNVGVAKKMKLHLPPLSIQHKIASILSSYDELIENKKQRIKLLEEMAEEIYKEWFVRMRFPGYETAKFVDGFPEGWKNVKLGDSFSIYLGGTPSREIEKYWNGNIPWINSGKVNDLRVIEPSEYITELGLQKSATKLFPKKTTLLAITGATLGQVSFLEIESCANQSVVGIKDPNSLVDEYIFMAMKEKIKSLINFAGGGAQQHINKNIVEEAQILMANSKIMNQFISIIKPTFELISNLMFKNLLLQQTRDLLLPRLISGKLSVEHLVESEDEVNLSMAAEPEADYQVKN
jgi:type I restriction enzyme S subunit